MLKRCPEIRAAEFRCDSVEFSIFYSGRRRQIRLLHRWESLRRRHDQTARESRPACDEES